MDIRRQKLRTAINESLRVQRGGATPVPYIDTSNALTDISARQNHVVFARRGCGKTLLLHQSANHLPAAIRAIYLNCEDFKTHSFPNVLIEILDSLFGELEKNLTRWFGRQRRLREIIADIRKELSAIKVREDEREQKITESRATHSTDGGKLGIAARGVTMEVANSEESKVAVESEYVSHDNKLRALNLWLPQLKSHIRDFFAATDKVQAVFVQVDDFYHLRRADQPHVMDYLHRLCKDVPLFFKVATLRHASTLYVDRDGQPTGAQERHDYQPINIDFSFHNFNRTASQVRNIFHEFGKIAGYSIDELDELFMGEGFNRLILVGGGVPRDCLSLFLEVLGALTTEDGRIGKDQVRLLSSSNFERRIDELKKDSETGEQDVLLRGIYMIREFCLEKKINVFSVEDKLLQQNEFLRALV